MGNPSAMCERKAVGYLSWSTGPGMSVTNVAKDASMAKSRRRWRLLLAFLCGAGLVSGGWAWWTDRRYQERDGGDRIGDHGRSIRDRLPKPGQALVLEGGPERGNRLPPGILRAGTGAKPGGRRSLGAGRAGFRVLGESDSGAHASLP